MCVAVKVREVGLFTNRSIRDQFDSLLQVEER